MIKDLFNKLKNSLEKTRNSVVMQMDRLFGNYDKVNEDFIEELEELLILSDLGFETTSDIIENLRKRINETRVDTPQEVRPLLEEILRERIDTASETVFNLEHPPKVLLIIGVNGAGKTTSIGKIANLMKNQGHQVLLAAGDTFRAAAIEQLQVWADRAGVPIVRHQQGSDPASVIYDAIQRARSRKSDILICDSAGRLHNKKNLMEELGKIKRIILREYDEKDVRTLLVLDATTGQNAINQAKQFKEVTDMDGIILTKLDGSSKGGFVFAIKEQLNIPVVFITLGEKIEDIAQFNGEAYVQGLFDKRSNS